ncbi:MAG: hypothetical protein K8H88_31195, partial [Sandaracinaceae bacterium]|nr:hypothetical protein [Sandaracinaceae bacterium]
MRRWAWVLAAALASACGGGGGDAAGAETSERSSGGERPRERDDGSSITGLMGTISRDAVEQTLQPRLEHFMGCFERRMGEVEFLAGDLRMSFRVHADGTVAWVYPSATSVGDRVAEQCVLEM